MKILLVLGLLLSQIVNAEKCSDGVPPNSPILGWALDAPPYGFYGADRCLTLASNRGYKCGGWDNKTYYLAPGQDALNGIWYYGAFAKCYGYNLNASNPVVTPLPTIKPSHVNLSPGQSIRGYLAKETKEITCTQKSNIACGQSWSPLIDRFAKACNADGETVYHCNCNTICPTYVSQYKYIYEN